MAVFEYEIEPFSDGFYLSRSIQKAVLQSQILINSGCQDILNIDLKGFFDEVDHCILLQLVYQKVRCRITCGYAENG